MKDLWINKWTPKCIDDIIGNKQAIKSIDNWLSKFDSTKVNNLIISGNHGIGKSLAIKLLLEKYNFYTKIIYPDDIKNYRLNNDFSDFYNFDTSIKHQMKFANNNYKKIALIFDDTECISLVSERKFIMGIHKDNSKKKIFPLIFISNNNHSKLLNDLKKNCLEVKFYSPSSFDVIKLVKKICKQEKILVKEPQAVMKLIDFSQNDIRRLINLLQEYSYCFNEITNKNIDDFIIFVDELDKRRGTNFLESFPELKEFYVRNKRG